MYFERYNDLWPQWVKAIYNDDWAQRLPTEAEIAFIKSTDRFSIENFNAEMALYVFCEPKNGVLDVNRLPPPPRSLAPLFFIPTVEFVDALAAQIRKINPKRVLEICAGQGFLGKCLKERLPRTVVLLTDNKSGHFDSWPLEVENIEAQEAAAKYEPEVIICAWAPYGDQPVILEQIPSLKVLFEIGEGDGGCTNNQHFWLRYNHRFNESLSALGTGRTDHWHQCVFDFYGPAHIDWGMYEIQQDEDHEPTRGRLRGASISERLSLEHKIAALNIALLKVAQ